MLLKYNALQAGWSPQAVKSLSVTSSQDGLLVEGSDDALTEEYGDAENRPKPAERQFANRRDAIDEQVARELESKVRGLL